MGEKELIEEVKRTLAKIMENNPSWRLVLGSDSLSADEVIRRLGNDKKLRKIVLQHYVGLAIEMEARAREKEK